MKRGISSLIAIILLKVFVAGHIIVQAGTPSVQQPNAESSTNASLRIVAQLEDGSRIVGEPSEETIPIQTSYAKIKVPLVQIKSIDFSKHHEEILIRLRNGDQLQGVTNLAEIKLKTLFGRISIDIGHLVSLQTNERATQPITDGLILWLDAQEFTDGKWSDKSGQSGDAIPHNITATDGAVLFNGKDSTVIIPKKHALGNFSERLGKENNPLFHY